MIEAEIVEEELKAPILKDIKYPVKTVDLKALLEEYAEIPQIDPDGKNVAEEYQYVLKGHKAFVKARTSIEKVRKELKAPALEYGKSVDGIAKEFQAMIAQTEQALFIQRKIVEDNEQRKQEAYEQAERERRDAIRLKIESIKNLPLDHFNSSSEQLTKVLESLRPARGEEYQEFLEEAQTALTLTISQLQQARENKLKSEQAEKIQAENEARLAEEQRIKDEQARKEREAFEAEKAAMQREREEMQREKDALQEQINLQNAEREAELLEKEQAEQAMEREEAEKKAEEERKKQEAKDKKLKAKKLKELYDKIEAQIEMFKTPRDILNAIIDNKIDHIRWES